MPLVPPACNVLLFSFLKGVKERGLPRFWAAEAGLALNTRREYLCQGVCTCS